MVGLFAISMAFIINFKDDGEMQLFEYVMDCMKQFYHRDDRIL